MLFKKGGSDSCCDYPDIRFRLWLQGGRKDENTLVYGSQFCGYQPGSVSTARSIPLYYIGETRRTIKDNKLAPALAESGSTMHHHTPGHSILGTG